MSNLKTIKEITFPNNYTIKLPYEVTIHEGEANHMIIEILLKQIIKLKEEVDG